MSEEIARRCFTIAQILESIKTTKEELQSSAELNALRSCNIALEKARIFVERFSSKGFVSKFLKARGFKSEFTDLNQSLSNAADDLQFALTGEVRQQVVAVHEVSQALLARFEHEHVEIIARFDKLDELISIGQDQQDALFNMFHGYSKEIEKLRSVVESLKIQKEQNPNAYKREAEKKFRNALHLQCGPPISQDKLTTHFQQLLGEGTFGKVYGGSLHAFGEVAVKTIPVIDGNDVDFLREVAAIERVSVHPNIISFYGWCYTQNPFTGSRLAALITERCVRSLYAMVKDHAYFPPLSIWISYLHQIASAMTFLIRKGMLHRDLKPENVLITRSNTAVISDFGLAVTKTTILASTVSHVSDSMQRKVGGTVGYMAPEVTASEASDVYSFGILSSFALLRETPWVDSNGNPLHPTTILSECKIRPPKMPSAEDFPELKSAHVALLSNCCAIEPSIRPHFCELEVALGDCFREPKDLLISQPSDIMLTIVDDEHPRAKEEVMPVHNTHSNNLDNLAEKVNRVGGKKIILSRDDVSDSDEDVDTFEAKVAREQHSKLSSKRNDRGEKNQSITNVTVQSEEKLVAEGKPRAEDKKDSDKIQSERAKVTTTPFSTSGVPTSPPPQIIYNFKTIERMTYGALKTFVMNPPPSRQLARCYIERSRAAKHLLSPFYTLCADLESKFMRL